MNPLYYFMDELEDFFRQAKGNFVTARDFNAKAKEKRIGRGILDYRRKKVMEMVPRLDLVVLNTERTTIFRQKSGFKAAGSQSSISHFQRRI